MKLSETCGKPLANDGFVCYNCIVTSSHEVGCQTHRSSSCVVLSLGSTQEERRWLFVSPSFALYHCMSGHCFVLPSDYLVHCEVDVCFVIRDPFLRGRPHRSNHRRSHPRGALRGLGNGSFSQACSASSCSPASLAAGVPSMSSFTRTLPDHRPNRPA